MKKLIACMTLALSLGSYAQDYTLSCKLPDGVKIVSVFKGAEELISVTAYESEHDEGKNLEITRGFFDGRNMPQVDTVYRGKRLQIGVVSIGGRGRGGMQKFVAFLGSEGEMIDIDCKEIRPLH